MTPYTEEQGYANFSRGGCSQGAVCICCRNGDIQYVGDPTEDVQGNLHRAVRCRNCQSTWSEFYELQALDNLNDLDSVQP